MLWMMALKRKHANAQRRQNAEMATGSNRQPCASDDTYLTC